MNILDEVRGAKTIALSGHENPDGDAIGSCTGLALYLEQSLPGVRVDVFAGDFSDSLRKYMPRVDRIRSDYTTDVDRYDVFIELDTDSNRLGPARKYFDEAGKRINIDHHESNPGDGDVNFIEPEASSTCELVYLTMDPAEITEPIARALYIGIITDTGVFKYSNTGKRTMEIAGELISHDLQPEFGTLINEIFYGKTYHQQQILGRALLESTRFDNDRCIVSVITRQMMDLYQVTPKDMDGIASQMQLTDGIRCAILIYEPKPGTFKVSLRSDGSINVASAAKTCGGGGHARAAGCTVNAPYREILEKLKDSIAMQEQMKGTNNHADK